jgi:hypothetical protein
MIKYAFIIPYRDREPHKHFFTRYMEYLLEDYPKDSYEIVFANQNNNLPFNRGGMKNCGFLYIKNKYPDDYKNIVFIFNDIDTLPYKKGLLNYDVKPREIKHFYGFNFALGGIFSIRGEDFEILNGFPALWSWGWEDSVLYERALENRMTINRDVFYGFSEKEILHLIDGLTKDVSMKNKERYNNKSIIDGLSNIKDLNYSKNEITGMLDITFFTNSYSPIDNSIKNFKINFDSDFDKNKTNNSINSSNSKNIQRINYRKMFQFKH